MQGLPLVDEVTVKIMRANGTSPDTITVRLFPSVCDPRPDLFAAAVPVAPVTRRRQLDRLDLVLAEQLRRYQHDERDGPRDKFEQQRLGGRL